MLELIQITNDPAFARRCDAIPGMRLMVDLERLGKAQRQAGRDTLISDHTTSDVAKVKAALRQSRLMVRVNPLHEGTQAEVDAAVQGGADLLMLPMFHGADDLERFAAIVGGRRGIVPLLERPEALDSIGHWISTPGIDEVYLGLNDLHLALRLRFMFEPLASGIVDRVADAVRSRGLRFGFGGIARAGEGLLPGEDVMAEHLRLRSGSVILSRTFHRKPSGQSFEAAVGALREAQARLALRNAAQVQADRERIAANIAAISQRMPARA